MFVVTGLFRPFSFLRSSLHVFYISPFELLELFKRSYIYSYFYRLLFQQSCCSSGSSSSVHNLRLIFRYVIETSMQLILLEYCCQIRNFSLFVVFSSSAVSLGSRVIPKKSALLCNFFRSGMKWRLNREYCWFILILFGSLSLSVLVISVTAASPSAQMNRSSFLGQDFFPILGQDFFVIRHYSQVYILGHFYVLDKFSPPQICLLYRLLFLEYG